MFSKASLYAIKMDAGQKQVISIMAKWLFSHCYRMRRIHKGAMHNIHGRIKSVEASLLDSGRAMVRHQNPYYSEGCRIKIRMIFFNDRSHRQMFPFKKRCIVQLRDR